MFIQLKIMHLQTILTVLFLIATEKCERPSSLCIEFGRPLFYSTIVYRVGLWEDDISSGVSWPRYLTTKNRPDVT